MAFGCLFPFTSRRIVGNFYKKSSFYVEDRGAVIGRKGSFHGMDFYVLHVYSL
jgi:hypothetical protein